MMNFGNPNRGLTLIRNIFLSLIVVISLVTISFEVVAASDPKQPFVVDTNSHMVVMQYMPWFGPNIASFSNSPVTPVLSSPEMKFYLADVLELPHYNRDTLNFGGYNSADRNVIKQHILWLKGMGVDAILLDHSNQTACSFGDLSIAFCSPVGVPMNYYFNRDLIENIKVIYDEFAKDGSIKIIPLIGGAEVDSTQKLANGKIPLKEQFKFYQSLQNSYPALTVKYEGKPLIVPFLAVVAHSRQVPVAQALAEFTSTNTIKTMGGLFESQPGQHTGVGLEELRKVNHWSWWDRYNASAGLYPTYTDKNGTAEAFTAVLAVPSIHSELSSFTKKSKTGYTHKSEVENGWGVLPSDCEFEAGVDSNLNTRCVAKQAPGVLGYRNGATVKSYFELAKKIKPTFLFIHEFNGFTKEDGGLDVEMSTDIEPTIEWGNSRMNYVTQLISDYKSSFGSVTPKPEPTNPSAEKVIGVFDGLDTASNGSKVLRGWTCSLKNTGSISVDLFVGGPIGDSKSSKVSRTTANIASEAGVASACQSTGSAYRFSIPVTDDLLSSHGGKSIYMYGVSASGFTSMLNGSGSTSLPASSKPPTSSKPPASSTPGNDKVVGTLDGVKVVNGVNTLSGWACVTGKTESVNVDVYAGGPSEDARSVKVLRSVANFSSESAVATACQSTGIAYRFSIVLSENILTANGGKSIFAYGVSINGSTSILGNSGKFNFPLARPVTPPVETKPDASPHGTVAVYGFFKGNDYFETVNSAEGINAGYQARGVSFYAYSLKSAGTIPVFRCNIKSKNDHFVSTQEGCEGQEIEGKYGYIYASQTAGHIPLFRYIHRLNGDHFASTDKAPSEYTVERILGYVPSK